MIKEYGLVKLPLKNMLKPGIDSWVDVFNNILNYIIVVAIPLSILAFILIGFYFIAAQGKPEKIKEAKTRFLFLVIGLLLLFSASGIGKLVGDAIDPNGSGAIEHKETITSRFNNSFIVSAQASSEGRFTNPLDSTLGKGTTLYGLLKIIVRAVIIVVTPILVLLYMYVGFLFIKAKGNQKQLTEAKDYFVWLVVGTLIIFSASGLINIIQRTERELRVVES